jgi:hypothetical protein
MSDSARFARINTLKAEMDVLSNSIRDKRAELERLLVETELETRRAKKAKKP